MENIKERLRDMKIKGEVLTSSWHSKNSSAGGHHPICWGPEESKKADEGWICSLLEAGHPPSPVCGHWCYRMSRIYTIVPGSWAFGLQLVLTSLAPLVPRPLGLDWNYTTGSPGPPAYRQQIMGLLSLYNHVSQCLKINLFLLYLYIFYHICFSGEL